MDQKKRKQRQAGDHASAPIRTLFRWSIACSGSIFLSVCFLPQKAVPWAGGLCLLASFAALFLRGSVRRKAALAAFGLAVGFLWTGFYQLLFRAPARSLISGETSSYIFEVTDYPEETARGACFSARVVIDGNGGPKVELYTDSDALDLRPGDIILAAARLAPSDRLRDENVDYYEAKGIFLLGYGQGPVTLLERPSRIPLFYWPQAAKAAIKSSVSNLFPSDTAGFITSLLTGDKHSLPQGLYAAFQRAGLSHIVAVSGLHISFLSGFLFLLLGKHRRFSVPLGIGLTLFFAAMVGYTPSALRAALMAGGVLLAPLTGREDDPPTTLAAVLVLLLLPCPYAAASAGLQLSFAAVAGIHLVGSPLFTAWTEKLSDKDKSRGKAFTSLSRYLLASLSTTIGAMAFTAPLSALYFRSVSLVWLVSNLLTLWAVSLVFLGGLSAALLGMFLPHIGLVLAWLTAWPARWVIWTARQLARLPFASIPLLSGYLIFWFCTAYLILGLWFWKRKQIRPLIPAGALVITLLTAFFVQSYQLSHYPLIVTALDVGQGASTLFYSQGETMLVDCGGNSDNAGDIAADYLQSFGCAKLDTLVLTHCHTDHANGVAELFSRIPVSRLILPQTHQEEPLREEIISAAHSAGCQVEILSQDRMFTIGNADIFLLEPMGDGGINEEGLSVLCSVEEFDVLLTGDMNDVVEKRLVKYKDLPDIELLMAGHHGSRHSTSEELLLATTPEQVVISSGYNNYGHPSPETLERLGAAGCDIYRTDLMGTITFYIGGNSK